jgi:TRAP transporter TAXI family solute receptor
MRRIVSLIGGILLVTVGGLAANAQSPARTLYEQQKEEINQITVSIVVSGMRCTCARFAEDIRNVVNDLRPDGVRVLPILGVGGIQNLQDVLFLKGVDMGTVDQDHLEFLEKKDPVLYANLQNRVKYITKLYNSEFQVAARKEFTSLSDLQGKRVSFNLENSHTHIAADIIFGMMGLTTEKTFHDNDEALQLLSTGKLDAHIVLTGAPQSGIARIKAADGIHLLPLSEDDLPAEAKDQLYKRYLPADLTHEHYPELIAEGQTVPTIATRTALAVYNWDPASFRYRKLDRFVQEFFSKIGEFNHKSRHPKWAEVNLAADIPGWQRFKPAQDWLDGNRNAPAAGLDPVGDGDGDIRVAFEKFLASYRQSAGQAPLSEQDRAQLFTQFKQFLAFQNARAESQ